MFDSLYMVVCLGFLRIGWCVIGGCDKIWNFWRFINMGKYVFEEIENWICII